MGRILTYFLFFALLCYCLFPLNVNAHGHILLKNDFNNDGIADRVIFASPKTSGFIQATESNKNVDHFFFQNGTLSITFINGKGLGGPYLKLEENAGIFSINIILKHLNKKFIPISSSIIFNKKYFFDDLNCKSNTYNQQKKEQEILKFSEAIKKYSVERIIKNSISNDCKKIFKNYYTKLEFQILNACGISDGKPEKNDFISCLDKNPEFRFFAGKYKMSLAKSIFKPDFRILCSKSETSTPSSSFDVSSNNITFYLTAPEEKEPNFKEKWLHEMTHKSGITDENKIKTLIGKCNNTNTEESNYRAIPNNELSFQSELEKSKEGIQLTLPTTSIPSTSVTKAITESTKTLNSNFSTEDNSQHALLNNLAENVFAAAKPLMNAAFETAVPKVFANNKTPNNGIARTQSSIKDPTNTKTTTRTFSGRKFVQTESVEKHQDLLSAQPAVVNIPSGNRDVSLKDQPDKTLQNRNIASSAEIASSEASSSTGGQYLQSNSAGTPFVPSSDSRTNTLKRNVPKIIAEEDFVNAITSGTYTEVKKRLLDPKNEPIMEDKRIQYYLNEKMKKGSQDPMIIMKDLGNSFSVRRKVEN